MIYVKVNDTLYPASISGKITDKTWDNRESKAITMESDFATVDALFLDGASWSIVSEETVDVTPRYQTDAGGNVLYEQLDVTPEYQLDENGYTVYDEDGNPVPYDGDPVYVEGDPLPYDGEPVYEIVRTEFDNSEFSIRGDVTVHVDGTCTVNMGKPTDLEDAYEILYGGV